MARLAAFPLRAWATKLNCKNVFLHFCVFCYFLLTTHAWYRQMPASQYFLRNLIDLENLSKSCFARSFY